MITTKKAMITTKKSMITTKHVQAISFVKIETRSSLMIQYLKVAGSPSLKGF